MRLSVALGLENSGLLVRAPFPSKWVDGVVGGRASLVRAV